MTESTTPAVPAEPQPTQVEHPFRTTLRTVFQGAVAFAAMWGLIVEAAGLPADWRWVSVSLVVTGAITRVMAVPQVEAWLARFIPWLAADPASRRH